MCIRIPTSVVGSGYNFGTGSFIDVGQLCSSTIVNILISVRATDQSSKYNTYLDFVLDYRCSECEDGGVKSVYALLAISRMMPNVDGPKLWTVHLMLLQHSVCVWTGSNLHSPAWVAELNKVQRLVLRRKVFACWSVQRGNTKLGMDGKQMFREKMIANNDKTENLR